jgi:predicted glycosyltransferase
MVELSSEGYRVAIYSQDGLGLGHLRRNSLIGREIVARAQNSSVLLLADSPAAPFFRLGAGMDHLKLPSIKKVVHGNWDPVGLQITPTALRRLRANILRDALLDYQPDLLLVDHMPGGARREMLPALATVRTQFPDCRIVLGLRDILDQPEVISRVWENEGAYDALRSYYDEILIYGDDQLFDTRAVYQLPSLPGGTHYCGYVVNEDPRPCKLRDMVLRSGRRFVFVSAGGGGDSALLMNAYIEAIRLLGRRADFDTLLAAGTNLDVETYECLERRAEGLPICVVPFTSDGVGHIAAADLVICMAGYNTISEVLYWKKKALVVPRAGPSAEQRMRADLLRGRGLIDLLDPDELTPGALAERVLEDLDRTDLPSSGETPLMGGASHAADRLLELLQ